MGPGGAWAATHQARLALGPVGLCALAPADTLFACANFTVIAALELERLERGAAPLERSELVARFGDVLLQAEYARKETRTARTSKLRLREFVDSYRQTDVHLVSFLPPEMQADVLLPPFLSCRPHAAHLDTHNLWWSAGNHTRSVLHNDDQDNLNCVLAGRKRFAFFHPREKPTIETDAFVWVNADGDRYGMSAVELFVRTPNAAPHYVEGGDTCSRSATGALCASS